MEVSELEALTELVKNARISELTIKQAGRRITIRKPADAMTGTELVPAGAAYHTEVETTGDWEAETTLDEPETVVIIAPLVGYFHHVRPLVGLGAHVAEGQAIATVRSMQLDNEVAASVTGTVTDLLVEDGQPVEYGQPLYIVQPSA